MSLSLAEVEANLNARIVMPMRAPKLAVMAQALSRFKLWWPEDLTKIILIAGTNGKGSVAKTLATLLRKGGASVGLFTSPHLMAITERIQINNESLSPAEFIKVFNEVDAICIDLNLSHFEMLTLMAVVSFFRSRGTVDWAVFEVGMGGTWDATNALPHKTCVITKLGYDHQHLLGQSLVEIARNKFGIVTDRALVFHAALPLECQPLAQEIAYKTNTVWQETLPYRCCYTEGCPLPNYFVETQWGKFALSLPGERGAENSALALTVFAGLGWHVDADINLLKDVYWPGRMSQLANNNLPANLYFSGDHNPQGIMSLIEILTKAQATTIHLLVGIGQQKDSDCMLELLKQIPNARIWLTETPFHGRTRAQYGKWPMSCAGFFSEPIAALKAIAREAVATDLIVVTGSLYLVGDLMRDLIIEYGANK